MAKLRLVDVKVGDKVKVSTDAYLNWGTEKGSIVTVTYKAGNQINVQAPSGQVIAVQIGHLDKLEETFEEISKDIKRLQKEILEQEDKIAWMEKTGNKVYDDTEFRVWTTLKTLSSKSSDEEKAKVIAELIKKG